MTAIAFVAVAAAATLVRVGLTANQASGTIPWRTLTVNTGGALVLGYLLTRQTPAPSLVWSVAGLGSLTTFSTVAAEIAALVDDDRRREAGLYLGITLVAGVAAARIGLELGANL